MQPKLHSKWRNLILLGLLVVPGIMIAYKINSCGSSCSKPPSSTSTLGGKVQHADEATFSQEVLKADIPVLVDFYADWCRPCKMLAPILEELAAENPNVKFVKVNVDENSQLADQYGIRSIPSLKLFKNGKITDELNGFVGKNQLQSLLIQ